MRLLTYVEIDVDYCANSYSNAPCTAAIPTTGDAKCFNTLASCQDRLNFVNAPATLRFGVPAMYLPKEIECIPSVQDISFSPATISLGEDLGQRATLTVTFSDHKSSDAGPGGDPYLSERGYDSFKRGTFWGKFRARQPYLQGRPLRVIRGELGQAFGDMEVRHYVIESFSGPTTDGTFTVTAKDVLKLADNDRAQAPRLSNGSLVSAIDDNDTVLNLSPAGIGNLEYPASGYVAIGGREICSFTRSGDVLTIVRARYGTEASSHAEQDRVQLCIEYDGEDPADIIYDLLVNYANIDPSFINLSAWQNETATYLQRVYSALLAEPTGVNKLVSELISQAALAMWWDDLQQRIRLRVLRPIPTDAALFSENNILESTTSIDEQPSKRLSQVWTYFGLRNPLENIDEPKNYRSTAVTVDLQAETDYGALAVKKVYSRWIPAFGRSVALRLNDFILGRYKDPPRKVGFALFRGTTAELGTGYRFASLPVQDFTGAAAEIPVQITRLNPRNDLYICEAEEALFAPFAADDLNDRVIIIEGDTLDFNLREAHDSLYPEITDPYGITVTCIVESGVVVGSTSVSTPAFDVGDWPIDLEIHVQCDGRIQGKGGNGGTSPPGGGLAISPQAGGTALYTRYPITLEVDSGEIWGGGGGGGAEVFFVALSGGGGGAGYQPGQGGEDADGEYPGQNGTRTTGGAGGNSPDIGGTAGAGGGPGLAGANGSQAGGAAGNAIDGDSYITVTAGPGDIRGPQIN